MTKTRSGDEDDNVCVEHSAEEKVNAMFANLGWEYKKCSDRSLEAWAEVTKMYRIKEGWSASVNILDKFLAHLMFNT